MLLLLILFLLFVFQEAKSISPEKEGEMVAEDEISLRNVIKD